MSDVTPAHEAAVTSGAGVGRVPEHGVVRVVGPDASTFLQSLVSADLDPVEPGHGARSLLLTPRGRLGLRFLALHVAPDEWLLVVDGSASELADALGRLKIRVDLEIADVTADLDRVDVRGPQTPRVVAAALAPVADRQLGHALVAGVRVVRDDWAGRAGAVVLGPGADVEVARQRLVAAGATELSAEALELARIDAGVPRLGFELDEHTIPQEAFLDREDISFDKGCFLGQELVGRIDARGRVNRLLRHLEIEGRAAPGDPIEIDGGQVGAVTSAVLAPSGRSVGLGYVHRDVEPPARGVVVAATGAVAVQITATASAEAGD